MKFWIAIVSIILLAGCATRVTVIPADKTVVWLAPGTVYTATNWVCVVPEARMQVILRKFNAPDK